MGTPSRESRSLVASARATRDDRDRDIVEGYPEVVAQPHETRTRRGAGRGRDRDRHGTGSWIGVCRLDRDAGRVDQPQWVAGFGREVTGEFVLQRPEVHVVLLGKPGRARPLEGESI
jgi:hypothetical protein